MIVLFYLYIFYRIKELSQKYKKFLKVNNYIKILVYV